METMSLLQLVDNMKYLNENSLKDSENLINIISSTDINQLKVKSN